MIRRTDRGILLPFLAVYLVLLCTLIGVNGERLLAENVKIERQRLADSLVLRLVHEQVRALNAIAALNQTLKLIRRRRHLFTASVAAVFACAASGTLSCLAPARRAITASRRFYKRLEKLETQVARQQDEIKSWGEEAPSALLTRSRTTGVVAHLYPDPTAPLRLQRKASGKRPEPYVWSGSRPRLTVLLATPGQRSPFAPFLAVGGIDGRRPDLWTLSEAGVQSDTLSQMNVRGRLVPIRQHREVLASATRAFISLSPPPQPMEFEHELSH